MARCPKLEYESQLAIYSGGGTYTCTITGLKMEEDNATVKSVCNPGYGEKYRECDVYKRYS